MELNFELRPGYLRAVARGRETAEQTKAAHERLLAEIASHGVTRVMAIALESRPIFKVETYNLSAHFDRIGAIPGLRLALISDNAEMFASHQYIQLLAQQRGLAVRAFRDEAAAAEWLLEG
jgi:hypothetical protein